MEHLQVGYGLNNKQ